VPQKANPRANPRTDLKVGHYKGEGGPPQKAGPTKAKKGGVTLRVRSGQAPSRLRARSRLYRGKTPHANAGCGAPGGEVQMRGRAEGWADWSRLYVGTMAKKGERPKK